MCGITGIFDTRGTRPLDDALIGRMTEALHHRGPDQGSVHVQPGLALGHRRLSILDLSPLGTQPMWSPDRKVVIVFNGEIYNFKTVRAELKTLGHAFRSECDTEVIIAAWQQWGEASVEKLNGMFAYVLWDAEREVLFMARDRIGIKPLYYSLLPDGRLLFGSELKALMLCPELPRKLDQRAVDEYFALGYVPDPRSIFEGVCKLEAGYRVTLRRGDGEVRPQRYWDVPFEPLPPASEAEYAEELIRRLRASVDSQLVSDVPLGAFLSGGVDSSSVVAMMADIAGNDVNTCSISFGDPAFNEARFAKAVAERYHTAHRERQVDPEDFSLLDTLPGLYDEPFADSSAMPTYRVCQLAREQVTVALSGDGGDESMAGYRRYRWHMYEERVRRLLPQAIRGPLFGLAGALYPKMDWAPRVFRAKATLQGCARDSVEGYFHSVSILPDYLRASLWSDGFRRDLQGYTALQAFRDQMRHAPTDHWLSKTQYLDFKTYLPGDILTKVDRASMAHSLEVRVPILDHELVEWMSGLPPDLCLHGREGKYIFKKALEPWLPHDVIYREKMGFAVPLGSWFRGPLAARMREAVLGPRLLDSGLFDADFLRRMVTEHQSGLREFSAPLWSLLMFDGFLRGNEQSIVPTPAARHAEAVL